MGVSECETGKIEKIVTTGACEASGNGEFPLSFETLEPAMTPALPIVGLNHIGLMTRRLEQSRRFYGQVLGFREVERPKFEFAGAWLVHGPLMLHLIENDRAGDPEREIQTRGNHLALHSDDLERVAALLDEHRVPYRKNEIKDKGIRQVFFQDPDGHHIEIGTYPSTPPFLDMAAIDRIELL